MKVNLLYCACAILVSIATPSSKLYAQCTVSNITVKLNSSNPSGGNCIINIDLSWDQSNNGGNKVTNVHLWTTAAYPNPAITYGAPPTAVQLQNALGTIVITQPASATPTLSASYQPAAGVTMLSASGVQKVYVSGSGVGTVNRFTVTGISLNIPGSCSVSSMIKADIWSSNAAKDDAVQCFLAGSSFVANDPGVSGLILCNNPRQFIVNLNTLGASSLQATYIVYADQAPLGTLDASDPVVYTSGTVTIPANGSGSYTSGPVAFNNAYAVSNLWVRVQVTGFPNSTVGLLTNGCSALPVKLTSFVASRTGHASVSLKWQTALEQNNRGFDVLRKDGTGAFKSIAFIATKASGGNSNNVLDYQLSDANNYSGETQYRLAQTDLDGKTTYSSIVLVRGDGSSATSMLIYPNPSYSGNTMLVFNNLDKKDISITDISGRIVQSATGVITNNYAVNGIKRGMYFIQVKEQQTGRTISGKIIIK